MALSRAEITRRYHERHPGAAAAASKAWRERYPDRWKAALKASREKRREQIRAYEGSEKELARRAAAKRRLRQDPAWVARERERARLRRLARDEREREQQAEYLRNWRIENRDRVRNLNRTRLARQRQAPGFDYCTPEKVEARRALYAGCCFYCGAENAEAMDHRIPVARGGTEWPANLIPACKTCNSSKGTRKPSEWQVAA